MSHARVERFGASVRSLRLALGMGQRTFARRIGRTQSYVSRVESGRVRGLSIAEADTICVALGATLVFGIEAPLLIAGPRQRDAAHAHCVAYVARRLSREGWIVAREVQIGLQDRPGWIDVLAYNPVSRVLLVIEVKTELVDFGGLERQLGWYEREARRAASAFGWIPRQVVAAALLLSTATNDERVRQNAVGVGQAFPRRWRDIMHVIRDVDSGGDGWAVAMIDPASRVRDWCRPTILDGRRTAAAYRSAAAFLEARR